ncbi:aldehyde dehydrogenase [Sphaerisporangium rufum]|uniref:Aldehyde dehydrogenase n=1 Tax=Sphaerisporangium rufum TaxID=1381558 RepID=A0A919QYS8_9ACTN|nr:aldehyde dehydrogenase [Sphaerisporangium rufum]GII76472.1 aldehyde dehydrogenase [Sphaerisporangium rufum]
MLLDRDAAEIGAMAEALRPETRAFIDGEYRTGSLGESFTTENPATGEAIAKVVLCTGEDVDAAVTSARTAFEDGRWSGRSPRDRGRVLLRLAELIDEHREELALLECLDTGKPIRDAYTADITKSAAMTRWYAEAADKLYDEVAPTRPDVLAVVRREPLGVVGCVTPWNFPLYQAAYKLGPVLVSGNSLIIKPAEQTPLTTIRLAALALEAGVPPGVLNVVPGDGPITGAALGRHPDVDCLAFTGSTATARRFLAYSAESNAKKVCVEAGGKSPHIVFPDAGDLDEVAEAVVWGIFYHQGQVCSAGSRLFVHRAIAGELLDRVVLLAEALRVGDPLDPGTQVGALISDRQRRRVMDYIERGRAEGARLLTGGHGTRAGTGGHFIAPTVFDQVRNDMTIAREEIFGPVLAVLPFDDIDEVVRLANDTAYGLGAGLWTRDIDLALGVAARLRAGQVWVNNYDGSDWSVPWGGFKQSGTARDKSLHAIDEYTAPKATWIQTRPPAPFTLVTR